MRIRLWCVVLAVIFPWAPLAAQTVLSEADALARLSPESPRVRAIRSSTEIARAEALGAGRWPNPRVSLNRESVAGISETLTTVLVPLPLTGRRGFEREAAGELVAATSNRADEVLRRARADLRLAYADLVAAQSRERELTQARDRLQELTDILLARERAGDAAGFDRLRAAREVLDLEADRLTAAAERAHAQGALAGFFADPINPTSIVAADEPVERPDLPAVEVFVEQAERTRGELLALERERESARLAGLAGRRRRLPEPELFAGTKSSSALGGDLGSVLGIQAVLPLFDRGRPEQALAEAHMRQSEARMDAFRLTLRSEIAALHAAVAERRRAAQQYRTAADGTDEIERIARVSYEAGERGILELLDAYRTSALARVRQASLDWAVRQSEIDLELVSGLEIP